MKILFELRASKILFNFLSNIPGKKPFLIPANICPIVPATFIKANTPFIFIDISLKTLEIDSNHLLEKLNNDPSAFGGVLWLRSYGVNNNNEKIFNSIKNYNPELFIIDDSCLLKPNFSMNDSIPDLIIYSTGYSKFVDYGWGGFGYLNSRIKFYSNKKLVYKKDDLKKLNESFKNCIENETPFVYPNSDWLVEDNNKCNYADYKKKIIDDLPRITLHKKKINSIYSNNIIKKAQLPINYQNWRFNLLVNKKKKLLQSLFSEKLFASTHYFPLPKLFNQRSTRKSERLFQHIVNLFNDHRYDEKMAIKTTKIVNNHIKKWGFAEL